MTASDQPSRENAQTAELEEAYETIEKRDKLIVRLTKEVQTYRKVEDIIVSAGLLKKDVFDNVRRILNS